MPLRTNSIRDRIKAVDHDGLSLQWVPENDLERIQPKCAFPKRLFRSNAGRACYRRAARADATLFLRPLHELAIHTPGRHG